MDVRRCAYWASANVDLFQYSFPHYLGPISKLFGNVIQPTYWDLVWVGLKRDHLFRGQVCAYVLQRATVALQPVVRWALQKTCKTEVLSCPIPNIFDINLNNSAQIRKMIASLISEEPRDHVEGCCLTVYNSLSERVDVWTKSFFH